MRIRKTLTILTLIPVLAWTLFPICWILIASFKIEEDNDELKTCGSDN